MIQITNVGDTNGDGATDYQETFYGDVNGDSQADFAINVITLDGSMSWLL